MFSFFKNTGGASGAQRLVAAIKNGAHLVDVRTSAEFATGHVPNSVNIPLDSLDQEIDALRDKNEIVVYCLSGGRSAQAKRFLNRNGFTNVQDGRTWKEVKAIVDNIEL